MILKPFDGKLPVERLPTTSNCSKSVQGPLHLTSLAEPYVNASTFLLQPSPDHFLTLMVKIGEICGGCVTQRTLVMVGFVFVLCLGFMNGHVCEG